MIKNITACPLDCYDACSIVYDNGRIKAHNDKYTKGFLCPHMYNYKKFERISKPRYKGIEISIDEMLCKLTEMLEESVDNELLHYRSRGNFGLMQGVTDYFFAKYGAYLTDGSLCDGAGEAGIVAGRGSNKNMSLSEIEKSEVVIIWGRNPNTTSSHLLPMIEGKTIVVIDPVKTKIAKKSNLFIQIKPHTDMLLAMLITRFLFTHSEHATEYIQKHTSGFKDYCKLIQTIEIEQTLDEIGVTMAQVEKIIEMIKNKKVAIVCGVGVQKFQNGADVMRSIDALAITLGLFAKEGCGISYVGNSSEGVESPFISESKLVSKVDTQFEKYKTVFIQAANPLSQMPNTLRVEKSISQTKNVIYFGLYENETSKIADLVIPAKSFLEKNDIRTSYSHNALLKMNQQYKSDVGISEYALAKYLCEKFSIELKSEDEYLEGFKKFGTVKSDNSFEVENREERAYKDGFDTEDGKFIFLDKISLDKNKSDKLHLITPKGFASLNSQFKCSEYVYLSSSYGLKENSDVKISSSVGSVTLKVKHNDDLREDCILIYSGTKGLNNITSSKHSYDGKCAIYQNERVEISA